MEDVVDVAASLGSLLDHTGGLAHCSEGLVGLGVSIRVENVINSLTGLGNLTDGATNLANGLEDLVWIGVSSEVNELWLHF